MSEYKYLDESGLHHVSCCGVLSYSLYNIPHFPDCPHFISFQEYESKEATAKAEKACDDAWEKNR